jgi:hypothetical protein
MDISNPYFPDYYCPSYVSTSLPKVDWTLNSIQTIFNVPQLEDNSKELKINIKKHQIKFNFNL